jgi:SAM-dependent methyltransferase
MFARRAALLAPDVPETRFGVWFQGTRIWRDYVLRDALGALERLLARPGARHARILDVGCGAGLALGELRARFAPRVLAGVDSDASLVAQARAAHPDAELRAGDVAKLEYADGSFDLVLCHQLLHHLSAPEAALAELNRVLAPGGVLLLTESCASFLRLWWVRLFFRHPRNGYRSAADYVALVRAAGFEVRDDAIATPATWWTQLDLGLLARFGVTLTPEPLVHLVATKCEAAPPRPLRRIAEPDAVSTARPRQDS